MPKIKINGKEYSFPQGMSLLEACKQAKVHVPYFCYHPVLKVVGSCRMCKVEIGQEVRGEMRWRVDISCNVQIAEGMEVKTDTPAVQKARQMTLEFLLKYHPLDCPICDDAGECKLQDYYYRYGKHDSRMLEVRRTRRKAFDIGPRIVLDSERCVLCSRCVRFLADVTHTHELGIFGMGAEEELMLAPDARLDNDYSGNVVDLCPVGALTDKDFRFKRRVWYLKSANSICQGCSRGCNIRIDYDVNPFHEHKKYQQMKTQRTATTHHQRIQRLKPNQNEEVNGHWICDHGRYGYKATDAADRVLHPLVNVNGELRQSSYTEVVRMLADGITQAIGKKQHKMALVISPRLTNEELFAVGSLFRNQMELLHLDHRLPLPPEWYGDNLLRTPDPYPNRTACEWLGLFPLEKGVGVDGLSDAILNGKIDSLLTILADPRDYLSEAALTKLKGRYFILRNLPADLKPLVSIALPAAAWGEYRGTFTNFHGRIQRMEAAFPPLGEALPVWKLMVLLSDQLKKPLKWREYGDVLNALGEQIRFFQGIDWETIGSKGMVVGEKRRAIKEAG